MKIGILTLHYRSNYGGILQCMALQNLLLEQGYDVEVIRFVPTGRSGLVRKVLLTLSSFYSVQDVSAYLNDIRLGFLAKLQKRKAGVPVALTRKCDRFISEHIRYTEPVDENQIAVFSSRYDAILVGSDQVWTGFNHPCLSYLFDWEPVFNGLKISYAACSANSKVPRLVFTNVKRCLNRFDALSVRDTNTYRLVQEVCGRQPAMVVDPTLLYDFQSLILPPAIEEPYVFTYLLGGEIKGGHAAVLEEIKRVYGPLKVVAVVLSDCSLEAVRFADVVINDAAPNEWLSLLVHSAFVYTDSFHGTIFSLKYKKSFLTYYTYAQRTSRLIDLRDRYRLSSAIVGSVEEMHKKQSIRQPIDYEDVESQIRYYREESLTFLRDSLHAGI